MVGQTASVTVMYDKSKSVKYEFSASEFNKTTLPGVKGKITIRGSYPNQKSKLATLDAIRKRFKTSTEYTLKLFQREKDKAIKDFNTDISNKQQAYLTARKQLISKAVAEDTRIVNEYAKKALALTKAQNVLLYEEIQNYVNSLKSNVTVGWDDLNPVIEGLKGGGLKGAKDVINSDPNANKHLQYYKGGFKPTK